MWNKQKYPNPDSLLNVMHGRNYKLNLWEHAYVHPTSPIFDSIVPYSGNYAVWKGAVPDFVMPQARKIFGDYHNKNFIQKGIAAFKLDECDAAYYHEANNEWSFPDMAQFPSGLDGEQMRQLLGFLYQKTMLDEYKKENQRTMLEVRASYLFAAPLSSALYTDMYSHGDFVRMIVNSGFSGLNWSPEVRQTGSDSDLIRRLQTTLMSSHMVVDCWFLKNLPWHQYNRDKNNRDELLPNRDALEQIAKKLIETRMSLIPYLYDAFANYHYTGIPPFRALVMDYPSDTAVFKIDNQYMMGDNILCAPFIDGASTRDIYFPQGTWFDFNSNKKYEGGKKYTVTMSLDEVPMFVKEGTILPLAKPVEYVTKATTFDIDCRVYGNADNKSVHLFEDNGYTFDYEKNQYNRITLSWKKNKGTITRDGNSKKMLYRIGSWKQIN
jgi:alpha-D-xyloside xylohydrolase